VQNFTETIRVVIGPSKGHNERRGESGVEDGDRLKNSMSGEVYWCRGRNQTKGVLKKLNRMHEGCKSGGGGIGKICLTTRWCNSNQKPKGAIMEKGK